jgi:hypothetical protein
MYVRLTRYYRSEVQCRGILEVIDDGSVVFECKTLELPWKENQNRISCIPPGPSATEAAVYDLRPRPAEESGSFDYDHFLVEGVEGRSYILIHAGNLYTQILGCTLVGREWVDINNDGHPDVTNSRETLRELRSVVDRETRFVVRWIDQLGTDKTSIADPVEEPDYDDFDQYIESLTEKLQT